MAVKKSLLRQAKEALSLSFAVHRYVSYADFYSGKSCVSVLAIQNAGSEAISGVTVSLESDAGLFLPFSKSPEEIPYEGTLEIETEGLLSPLFLQRVETPTVCEVRAVLKLEKEVLSVETASLTVLPFGYSEGIGANLSGLSGYVRPRLADCQSILFDAQKQVQKWGGVADDEGYLGKTKNDIRQKLAAVYTALKKHHISRRASSYTRPFAAGSCVSYLSATEATAIEAALFAASSLEAMGLHPVIGIGEDTAFVGVHLSETCFVDEVSEDIAAILSYAALGAGNLSLFDVEDIFDGKNTSYATSEKNTLRKAEGGAYLAVIDVKRCRMSHIEPLPIRPRGRESEPMESFDAAPAPLPDMRELRLAKMPKNKQWERKLLDLSLKNNLLCFHPHKNALRVFYPAPEKLYALLAEIGEVTLLPYAEGSESARALEGAPDFSKDGAFAAYREITEMELRQGNLRTFGDAAGFSEHIRALLRKSRAAEEETGAAALYLATGFLHFTDPETHESCASPLLLLPVTVKKSTGRTGYSLLPSEEGHEVNTTLLEFLKIRFDIDIRGLDRLSPTMPSGEIFSAVRSGIAGREGFSVSLDSYLSVFSFARYAMWNDIRKNYPAYRKNKMVQSLVEGKNLLQNPPLPTLHSDDLAPHELLTPLSADDSQYAAIASAQSGASFVLHGPPGTGKSQTITNMIANALYRGRRVLFVAEKQAALSVVKKRLDAIGLSDFCLELHSAKLDKSEVIQKIENTLSLRDSEPPFTELSDAHIEEVRALLRDTSSAMHKKRRLGISVYEGIVNCFRYKSAPDLFRIESGFFDSLTEESLENYRVLLTNAAAAAQECGGVADSPFANVRTEACDAGTRNAVVVASEVLIADIKNLQNYIELFLNATHQKISSVTRQKIANLSALTKALFSPDMQAYTTSDGASLAAFYAANRRYDNYLSVFFSRYKQIPDIQKEYERIEEEADNWGENYRSSAVLSSILKKLAKVARGRIHPEDEMRDIELVGSLFRAAAEIRSFDALCKSFVERSGSFHPRRREDFLRPLYDLNDIAKSVCLEYNAAEMNRAVVEYGDGQLSPLLSGLSDAVERFLASEKRFLSILEIDPGTTPEEDVFGYYRKKATALLDNMDMLPAFSLYRTAMRKLEAAGLSFVGDFMEKGSLSPETLLPAFLKSVYKNFLETNIPQDPVLSRFSAAVLEDTVEEFRRTSDAYDRSAGDRIRHRLIERLPTLDTEGALSLELVAFRRLSKQPRGVPLREILDRSWELLSVTSPCLLMSPATVSQYLKPETELFDLVIFDEASQMPTCEAVPALARARAAVVVGDQNQLPPTTFFQNRYTDEENLETEDMESLLDEWLTLSLPEQSLLRHYRSRHESLIAFSNAMYYKNRLLTFPSPDAMESKVRVCYIQDGVYARGEGKHNRREAEALVAEVVRRLKDPKSRKASIGVVTFSTAQQEYIDRLLQRELLSQNLDSIAYDREEPLFVKNLENVQGDERDVILFSVCYGPDQMGKLSLNFGPLNLSGGWRRLNVAVSRAREEMLIYSSLTSAMIDPSRTGSQGVLGLRAFLQFAEKGRSSLPVRSDSLKVDKNGMGKYIADELRLYGYDCRFSVGASDFKLDVAVIDPRNKKEFILAILCDGGGQKSVRDRCVLEVQALKKSNWNVLRVYALSFYNNPKREVKRIKDILDKMTKDPTRRTDELSRLRKPYKTAKLQPIETTAAYVTSFENKDELLSRLRSVVAAEEPITREFLIRRVLSSLGIHKSGVKLEAAMQSYLRQAALPTVEIAGTVCYYKNEKACCFDRFRVEAGDPIRRSDSDFTPYDILSLVLGVLASLVSVPFDELVTIIAHEFKISRVNDAVTQYIDRVLRYGEEQSILVRSIANRLSLA